jgi:putative sugar transport-related, membrane protein
MDKKMNLAHIIPVLMSFFVMSFIDLVGTGVDELKKEGSIPAHILQLIPFVAFIWFFFLSVPIGLWQDKIGKKKVLLYGIIITAVALFIPIFGNTLPVILTAFSLIGIGNTILQVAANPLLVDVVPQERASSMLSFSQFIKAIGSMVGPFIAAKVGPFLAQSFGMAGEGEWRFALYLFAVVSVLTAFWLSSVKINESKKADDAKKTSFSSCIQLLGNRFIALMVLGIFFVVGIDVAMNSNIGTYLIDKISIDEGAAKYGKSIYFFAKMLGAFLGAILLTKISAKKFLIGSAWLSIFTFIVLIFVPNELTAWVLIFLIGLGIANIFPLIFSIAVEKKPEYSNEISGLMMMAISGGAFLPFVVGLTMSKISLETGIFVLLISTAYLLFLGYFSPKKA